LELHDQVHQDGVKHGNRNNAWLRNRETGETTIVNYQPRGKMNKTPIRGGQDERAPESESSQGMSSRPWPNPR
jgi:hypothetical protein